MAVVRFLRQAAIGSVTIAMLAGALAGCGSGETGPGQGEGATKASIPHKRFAGPGTAVLVWCASTETGMQVMVASVSMREGRTVASSTFELPEGVEPSLNCEAYDSTRASPAAVRAMFDHDFQRMAVTVTDDTTGAKRASTVGTATGVPARLPSVGGGFASAPKEQYALFRPATDHLWFINLDPYMVMSRDPSSGRTTSHGRPPGDDATAVAVGAKGHFPVGDLQINATAVAPDGKHALVADLGGGCLLTPVGKLSNESPSIGGLDPLPGKAASCGTPQAWLDDQNLLTLAESGFQLITFSAGRASITDSRTDLVPKTSRRNFSAVASPDGGSFAFLSRQGQRVTLYTQALAPGSTPAEIADISPPIPPEDTLGQTLVPYLLAWQ